MIVLNILLCIIGGFVCLFVSIFIAYIGYLGERLIDKLKNLIL